MAKTYGTSWQQPGSGMGGTAAASFCRNHRLVVSLCALSHDFPPLGLLEIAKAGSTLGIFNAVGLKFKGFQSPLVHFCPEVIVKCFVVNEIPAGTEIFDFSY